MSIDELDSVINASLKRYPLQPLPAGFVARTMSRIARPEPFHIHLSDFIFPLALTALVLVLTTILIWFNGLLTIPWLPQPRFDPAGLIATFSISWSTLAILALFIEAVFGLTAIITFFLLTDQSDELSVIS